MVINQATVSSQPISNSHFEILPENYLYSAIGFRASQLIFRDHWSRNISCEAYNENYWQPVTIHGCLQKSIFYFNNYMANYPYLSQVKQTLKSNQK